MKPTKPLVQLDDLRVWFPVRQGILARTVDHVRAVDGVTLDIHRGETLGLVGESGSGKTTLGRALVGLEKPHAGRLWYDGQLMNEWTGKDWARNRSRLQIVFQDPFASLNPRMTVLDIVTEGPAAAGRIEGSREDLAVQLLEDVGLRPDHCHRYPFEFSGGQRQRISVARALSMQPDFIVCDEAVSALDVSVQAQVINLLMDLKTRYGLTYLFISHDLSVVRHVADRLAVMKDGRIVESGTAEQLWTTPEHPYTIQLIEAVPTPGGRRRRELKKEAADA